MIDINKVKVVILAGGLGSRISQYSEKIPKPMIKIGKQPMLSHIMRLFMHYGFNNFLIAGGYKIKVIRKFYKNSKEFKNLKIIETGKKSQTGGRILRLKKYLKDEKFFFLTYGDGVSNVNLNKLLKFHLKKNKIATITAVRPPVKFGELIIKKNSLVKTFLEKPQINRGWINGGFFIFSQKIFNFIFNSNTVLEQEPLQKISKLQQLAAYKHNGYWRCMDNLNEKKQLEKIYKEKKTIWKIK